jgi:hypothetical protein
MDTEVQLIVYHLDGGKCVDSAGDYTEWRIYV